MDVIIRFIQKQHRKSRWKRNKQKNISRPKIPIFNDLFFIIQITKRIGIIRKKRKNDIDIASKPNS